VPGSLFVLLPPSEGKELGGAPQRLVDTFAQSLDVARRDVLDAIAGVLEGDEDELARITKVRGKLLARARTSFEELVRERALYLPAWRRYSGVVWRHLDPATLSRAQRESLLVPSGLYGVTTANDDVADYRMKMDVVLEGLGHLGPYWRPRVTPVIARYVQGAPVVDLLPKEHASALDVSDLEKNGEVIRTRFVDASGERAVGHDAKAVKGIIARRVLSEGLSSVESVQWRGWRVRVRNNVIEARAPRHG